VPEPDSPNFHRVHHLLWECYAKMVPLADELFADGELTLSLAGTLDLVGTWPGSTAAELSRRSPKTQQAISQLVARLEKLGYVERRLGPGRGVGLYLTPTGQAAQADGHRREEQLELRLRELLGDEDHAQLGEVLERASASLDE
jgi:DNA-binding MarR family transcriptional regulator